MHGIMLPKREKKKKRQVRSYICRDGEPILCLDLASICMCIVSKHPSIEQDASAIRAVSSPYHPGSRAKGSICSSTHTTS